MQPTQGPIADLLAAAQSPALRTGKVALNVHANRLCSVTAAPTPTRGMHAQVQYLDDPGQRTNSISLSKLRPAPLGSLPDLRRPPAHGAVDQAVVAIGGKRSGEAGKLTGLFTGQSKSKIELVGDEGQLTGEAVVQTLFLHAISQSELASKYLTRPQAAALRSYAVADAAAAPVPVTVGERGGATADLREQI